MYRLKLNQSTAATGVVVVGCAAKMMRCAARQTHFLEGNRLSRIRLAPQLAAPPMTPPATARPINTAPATTIGATFASGALVAVEEEKEGSTAGFIFTLYVMQSQHIIFSYTVLKTRCSACGFRRAGSNSPTAFGWCKCSRCWMSSSWGSTRA